MQDDSPFEYTFPDGHVVELSFKPGVKAKYFPNGKPDWDALRPHAERAYQRDIAKYNQDWLGERSSGSTPALRYREYATSKNQKNFDFQGLSPLGQRAIREKFAAEQGAAMAGEKSALISAGQRAMANMASSGGEYADAGFLGGFLAPVLNRRMTSAVTGQEASRALPLGLDPQGQLNTGRAFGPTLRRNVGQLGRAEGMAAVASAPVAAGLVSSFPILGLLGGAASIYPTGRELVQGNFGGAAAEALTGIPLGAAFRPIKNASRALTMAENAMEHRLAMAGIEKERQAAQSGIDLMKSITKKRFPEIDQPIVPTLEQRIANLSSMSAELRRQSHELRLAGQFAEAKNAFDQANEIDKTLSALKLK